MTYKLYVSKDCGHCDEAIRCLKEQGIKFKKLDVDKSKRASQEADKLNIRQLPALVRGNKIVKIKDCIK